MVASACASLGDAPRPLGQLLNEVCGGPLPGRKLKAVIPGGSSAKILRFGERFKGKRKAGAEMVDYDWGVEDIPMDFDSLAMIGSMGGSGASNSICACQ